MGTDTLINGETEATEHHGDPPQLTEHGTAMITEGEIFQDSLDVASEGDMDIES